MPLITLTSDFGLRDYSVAAWKGKLFRVDPQLTVVDISHAITPFNIEEAAYILRAAYAEFPASTIHMISVFDFYQSKNRVLFFEHNNHIFIGPDNGLFSLVFDQMPDKVFALPIDISDPFPVQSTYSSIYRAYSKSKALDQIGQSIDDFSTRLNLQPVVGRDQLRGSVIFIDRYGNAVVNIHRSLFESCGKARPFKLYFKRFDPITEVLDHYMESDIGQPLCTFNAQGFLELAVNLERADTLLGLKKGDTIQIEFLNEEV